MTTQRRAVLAEVAEATPPPGGGGGAVRVAVDGVDGAGKTLFPTSSQTS